MKILRLTTSLDYGGQEKKIELLAKNYNGPHELIFAALGHGGATSQILSDLGYKVILLNISSPSVYNFRVWRPLYGLLKSISPDVLHNAAAEANFHGGIVGKFLNIPTVITEEIGLTKHRRLARILFKLIYLNSSDFVWISKSVQYHLEKLGEVNKNVGTLIYNPVEKDMSLEPSPDFIMNKERFILISTGRLVLVKNFELVINAISELKKDGIIVDYYIIGNGAYKAQLTNRINELELSDQIYLLGFKKSPQSYVKQADLFVLPSFSEGFGIAIVEAMLAETLSIGSKVGGIPEIIEDGISGWIFDPMSQNELTDLIRKVIELDRVEKDKIVKKAFNEASSKFTPETYVELLIKLYDKYDNK
jgi:glycosyltransferase involved in cell wall biosynthesis